VSTTDGDFGHSDFGFPAYPVCSSDILTVPEVESLPCRNRIAAIADWQV
jgi:hypothetical protein